MNQPPRIHDVIRRHRLAIGMIAGLTVASVWYFSPGSFNRTIWRAHHGDTTPDNPRWGMRNDLRWRYLRSGMSGPEVIALLGEPDRYKQPAEFSYNLGMHSGFGIDEDSLDLDFDPSGGLIRSSVVQH